MLFLGSSLSCYFGTGTSLAVHARAADYQSQMGWSSGSQTVPYLGCVDPWHL